MGSLGLPARAMAVRSAFALLCFALLCGLATSSVVQPETETELTKKEGEAAGNEVLVEQALESRVVRGTGKRNCKSRKCEKCRERGDRWDGKKCIRKPSKRTNNQEKRKACIDKGRKWDKDSQKCSPTGRSNKKNIKETTCTSSGGKWKKRKCVCPG